MPKDTKLARLETLLKLETIQKLSEKSLSKEDVTKLVEALVKVVRDVKSTNVREWNAIQDAFSILSKRLEASNNDIGTTLTQEVKDTVAGLKSSIEAKVKAVDIAVASIKNGEDGLDGKTPTEKELLALIKPLIPEPIKGDPGKTGSAGASGRPMVGWGAHPLAILDGGVTKYKVARTLNFGSNLTVSVNASGVITVDASSGTPTELAATGTINSINTTFTFISKPTYLFIDGVKYRENEGWTWSVLTATVTKAPDYSIWGEA